MKLTQQPVRRNRPADFVAVHKRGHANVRPRNVAGEAPNVKQAGIAMLPGADVRKLGLDYNVQISLSYSLDSRQTRDQVDYRVTRLQASTAHSNCHDFTFH